MAPLARKLIESIGELAGTVTGGQTDGFSNAVTDTFNPPPAVTNERYGTNTNERNTNGNSGDFSSQAGQGELESSGLYHYDDCVLNI